MEFSSDSPNISAQNSQQLKGSAGHICTHIYQTSTSPNFWSLSGDWEALWWCFDRLKLCPDYNELHVRCVCISTVPETLVTQNTRWRCKDRKCFLTDVSIDSDPLIFWTSTSSSHITRFSSIDPILGRPIGIFMLVAGGVHWSCILTQLIPAPQQQVVTLLISGGWMTDICFI